MGRRMGRRAGGRRAAGGRQAAGGRAGGRRAGRRQAGRRNAKHWSGRSRCGGRAVAGQPLCSRMAAIGGSVRFGSGRRIGRQWQYRRMGRQADTPAAVAYPTCR